MLGAAMTTCHIRVPVSVSFCFQVQEYRLFVKKADQDVRRYLTRPEKESFILASQDQTAKMTCPELAWGVP